MAATNQCGGILVVDDDGDIREAVSELLTDEGFRVQTAANGRDALTMLRNKAPCLMLLDLRMPVMDGYQVLDVLSHSPELSDIPVAVVSAERAPASGSAGCIQKPIDIDRLLDTVHRCCDDAVPPTP